MLNPDSLLERNKLKQQLSTWRGLFFLVIIAGLLIGFGNFSQIDKISGVSKPFIARIEVEGIIMRDIEREEILRGIEKNDNIKAVILNINSPGGTAVGGESLYKAIKKINEKKPVVSVMNTVAASAAYMTALGTEKLYAYNGSIVGSIGVLSQIPNVKEAADSLGIKLKILRTSKYKAAPSAFEDNPPDTYKIIEETMEDFYGYFKNLVQTERNLNDNELPK
jgi:protease-4